MDQLLPLGYPCETLRLKPNNETLFRSASSPVQVGSCRSEIDCSGYGTKRFRTIDGTCNNIEKRKSLWGSKGSEFVRLAPRTRLFREQYPPIFFFVSKDRTLPNARDVSSQLHNGPDERMKEITTMVMQVGQFLDHDITLTEEVNLCNIDSCPSEIEIDCCDYVNYESYEADNAPRGCMPILVPKNDEFYSKQFPKVRCLDFKISRTTPTCSGGDHNGFDGGLTKEPFNSITSFVDASQVYGSTQEKAFKLRSFEGGLLRVNEELAVSHNDGDYLPNEEVCPGIEPEMFFAGDARSNENPGLQSQHTLWLREHNRIAREFQSLRPDWDDEQIYQESRRLVIAQWQQIVYQEFLPTVLGKDFVRLDEKLNVGMDSYYDPDVSPDILMSFSTAAFRFGHSLITSNVNTYRDGALNHVYELKNIFFNTSAVKTGEINEIIEGMLYQRAEMGNSKMTSDVRNFLFHEKSKGFGSDLASRNIQRGRDHELAPYGTFRKLCGLPALPSSFHHETPEEFNPEIWSKLGRIYAEPEDIELFPGGMSEIPLHDAVVGPTFACLIAEQFRRLRAGDRYFFTHKNVHSSNQFCEVEREQIRRRTLSDIVCDNTNLKFVGRNAFKIPSLDHNPIFDCERNNKLFVNVSYSCPNTHESPHQDKLDDKFPTSNMVALLVGGYNGEETLNSVETYSPKGTCQHQLPDFPVKVYNINLMYIGEGQTLACGGRTIEYGGRQDCWLLDPSTLEWILLPNLHLNYQRWLSGSAMHLGSWILSGGYYSRKTTEILSIDFGSHPDNWVWIPGPDLPGEGRSQHCMVIIYDDLIVMGGFGSGMSVQKYNFNTQQWTTLTSTLIYYRYKHQCVTLPEYNDVLLMGGPHGTVYNLETEERFLTESPLYPRNYGAVVNLGQRVFAFGGDKYSTTVEEYNSRLNKFNVVPYTLSEPRSRFGVAAVPDYLFNGLPGGCKG